MNLRKSRTYGREGKISDWGAMVYVLRLGWAALAKHGKEQKGCPFEFEDDDDGDDAGGGAA